MTMNAWCRDENVSLLTSVFWDQWQVKGQRSVCQTGGKMSLSFPFAVSTSNAIVAHQVALLLPVPTLLFSFFLLTAERETRPATIRMLACLWRADITSEVQLAAVQSVLVNVSPSADVEEVDGSLYCWNFTGQNLISWIFVLNLLISSVNIGSCQILFLSLFNFAIAKTFTNIHVISRRCSPLHCFFFGTKERMA